MFRIRHFIQLAIILGCLTWGGYQITSNALAESQVPAASTAVSSSTDKTIQSQQSLEQQYPGLPKAVAETVHSVVATQRMVAGAASGQNGYAASGVVINDQQILTAGHNVEDGAGLSCSQTAVVAQGAVSRAAASRNIATYASVEYGRRDDIAVLSVNANDNFRALPDAPIAATPAKAGDTVYFANFQPTSDGKSRSPMAAEVVNTVPAVFSATMLGKTSKGIVVAAGGGRSFGTGVPDVMLRRGASGGAVINSDGAIVGLSVSSASLAADRSAASVRSEYGVTLPEQNYQIAYVQPVDRALVAKLQTGMVSCGS